ncbi:MAG: lytic murein transglycosylase [Hyphomicrobiales bacterium]|nr:lytic murein transglycosylase [Hyphomicrobiales bacterium]
MRSMRSLLRPGLAVAALLAAATAVQAEVPCRTSGSFENWLDGFRREAAASGISRNAIDRGLAGVAYDPAVIKRDHGQGVFQQSFLQFSDRMISSDRLSRGPRMLQKYGDLFHRIETKYGVPGAVLVAFWGLETDFGSDLGKYRAPSSVATLAYDCRRAAMFRTELMGLLKVVERGDLAPEQMVGDWAGELGHLMFSPHDYARYGTDFDGDGRADVIHSIPDAMASGAAFLQALGWRRGEPWLESVRVPEEMDWSKADPEVRAPRGEWARAGVRKGDGSALAAGGPEAWLWLPMGRNGPAFLAYPNFDAYLGWNKAMVYATTAAYYATRIAGAPPLSRGRGDVPMLSTDEVRRLQTLLRKRGYSDEEADGRIGSATRAAVRKAQEALGLPADSYPDKALISALAQ